MQDEIGKRANLVVHDTASAPDLQPHCRVRLGSVLPWLLLGGMERGGILGKIIFFQQIVQSRT